jgi:two-component system sensor histidine kinase BaeS
MKVRQIVSSVRHSLALRIISVVIISGPFVLLVFTLVSNIFFRNPNHTATFWVMALRAVISLSVTIFLVGWLTTHLVTKPLKKFNGAIKSLKENNYKVQLENSGIYEFDPVFKNFNELSKRLNYEEELRKNLISDTSHEFNTPLTAIKGQLTAMQDGKLSITKARLATIQQQTDRLIELVTQLSAYTKARVPNSDAAQTVNLKNTCKLAVSEALTGSKGVKAEIKIPDTLELVVNPTAFKQIVSNLIQNTLSYSGATKLTIHANSTSITYTDNGKGVPEESLPHLFERFYRVDGSRNRSTGGLGLGLAIVKELVEQQNWNIRAETAYPGLSFVIKYAD